jgi:hypothetical protein
MEKSKEQERDFGWQESIGKPFYTSDGKEIGFIASIQSDKIIVASGPVTPDKFLIPKSMVRGFENGTVYLRGDSSLVTKKYRFE